MLGCAVLYVVINMTSGHVHLELVDVRHFVCQSKIQTTQLNLIDT